jgi:nucleotide-binding universal stress UspA family protein
MKSSDRPYVIVVGIDYSEASHLALRHAFQTACERHQTEVHVLHVQTATQAYPHADPAAKDVLARALERLQGFVRTELASFQEAQRRPETGLAGPVSHVRDRAPAEEIAQLASDLRADLVVVGTHGRAGEARLGSVEHAVVTLAPCPVLIVREKTPWLGMAGTPPLCSRRAETRSNLDRRRALREQREKDHVH